MTDPGAPLLIILIVAFIRPDKISIFLYEPINIKGSGSPKVNYYESKYTPKYYSTFV